jgi:hypothetical protein
LNRLPAVLSAVALAKEEALAKAEALAKVENRKLDDKDFYFSNRFQLLDSFFKLVLIKWGMRIDSKNRELTFRSTSFILFRVLLHFASIASQHSQLPFIHR